MRISPWLPAHAIDRAVREPLPVFRKGAGTAPFLIVRLDDFSNELGAGLAAADEAADRRRFTNAMKATLQISAVVTEQMKALPSSDFVLPGAKADPAAQTQPARFPIPEWLDAKCYVVRLFNRSEQPSRLSIGRDINHSIVLRHPSVSSNHAYLELGNEITLRDAPSRNGSFVNGKRVKSSVAVRAGDRVKFGAVHTLLCSPDDLWHALH